MTIKTDPFKIKLWVCIAVLLTSMMDKPNGLVPVKANGAAASNGAANMMAASNGADP